MREKIILITGASAGMGKETAMLLLQKGYTVYAAARRLDKMDDIRSLGARILKMDVTDDISMINCVQHIIQADGRIDVLINNAGFGFYGAVEDVPISDARYQLEVNLLGAARLCQLILPYMRAQNNGKIINVSSMGGRMSFPFGGWYHASKYALEGLSDAMRNEVKRFGIDVILIEPGGIRTEWGQIAYDNLIKESGDTVYAKPAKKMARMLQYFELSGSKPIVIARLILKAIEKRRPRARYTAGYMAKPMLFLKRFLSDSLFDWAILKVTK